MKPVLVVGCGRSGTTATANLLRRLGASVLIEPHPAPHLMSRLILEGESFSQSERSEGLRPLLERLDASAKIGRVNNQLQVEKQVCLGPLISDISAQSDVKFVHVHRSGLDVVASWLGWIDAYFGNALRDQVPHDYLTASARLKILGLPLDEDLNDLGYPRPIPGSDVDAMWGGLTRVGKFAYMWSTVVHAHVRGMESLAPGKGLSIAVESVFDAGFDDLLSFAGLQERHRLRVETVQGGGSAADRNSLEHRTRGQVAPRPWFTWTSRELAEFRYVAGETMAELGYEVPRSHSKAPKTFGIYWESQVADASWFTWMHESRRESHEAFESWVSQFASNSTSVLELGCGAGVHYPKWFSDSFEAAQFEYTGMDLSRHAIGIAQARSRLLDRTRFHAVDFMEPSQAGPFDLVFSQGTIDNTYDMNRFVQRCVELSREWVYITFCRSTREHGGHLYTWNPEHGCFYNNADRSEIDWLLGSMGVDWWTWRPVFVTNSSTVESHLVIRVGDDG